jgi:hypothetical protein
MPQIVDLAERVFNAVAELTNGRYAGTERAHAGKFNLNNSATLVIEGRATCALTRR